jgi:hypothetical protein
MKEINMNILPEKSNTTNVELMGIYKRLNTPNVKRLCEFVAKGNKYVIKIRKTENITAHKAKHMLYQLKPLPNGKDDHIFMSSVYGVEDDPLKSWFDYQKIDYLMAITPDHIEIKIDISLRSKE